MAAYLRWPAPEPPSLVPCCDPPDAALAAAVALLIQVSVRRDAISRVVVVPRGAALVAPGGTSEGWGSRQTDRSP